MRLVTWGAVVLAFFIWRNGRVLKHTTLTKSTFPVGYYASGDYPTDCSLLAPADDPDFNDLKYCEDETFWDVVDSQGTITTRHLILSCDANRKSWNTVMGPLRDPNPRGSLWLYTSGSQDDSQKPTKIILKDYPPTHDFHPLGLEISSSHSGNASNLFVINHARQRTTIEQFTVLPDDLTTATYVRTLSSPYFVSPNALALTSPTSFYVTNDHFFTRRLPWPLGNILPMMESVLALPLGWVSHVSLIPNTTDPVAEPVLEHKLSDFGIPFANGVSLSPDGSTVALASTSSAQIYFYSREPTNNTLRHTHSVPVPFTPDNIAFDDSGTLIVTGHPHFPSVIGVAANKTGAVAPSWVVSVSPRPSTPKPKSPKNAKGSKGEATPTSIFFPSQEYDLEAPISASLKAPAMLSHEVETLFQSNGTGFSTSSTALRDPRSGELYITGLYAEEGVIVCRPNLGSA